MQKVKRFLQIFVLALLTTITSSAQGQHIWQPTWSPDSQSIAYITNDGIHVINKDGENDRLITSPAGLNGWTPDNKGLVVAQNNYPETPSITWWIYPIEDSEPTQLFPEFEIIHAINYSHDGERIAISAQKKATDPNSIWIAHADGHDLQQFGQYSSFQLTWASDDKAVIFPTRLEVDGKLEDATIIIQMDNASQTVIYPDTEKIRLSDTVSVAYDINQSYLPLSYYATDVTIDDTVLVTIDALVSNLTYSEASEMIAYAAYCNPADVADSFLRGEWSADEQMDIETALFTVDVETGETTEIIPCGDGSQMDVSFSPDGQSLLFVWIKDGQWALYQGLITDLSTLQPIT